MRTEEELKSKLKEIEDGLSKLEGKWFKTDSDRIQIEFHKNNIAFIRWALDKPSLILAEPISTKSPNLLN